MQKSAFDRFINNVCDIFNSGNYMASNLSLQFFFSLSTTPYIDRLFFMH